MGNIMKAGFYVQVSLMGVLLAWSHHTWAEHTYPMDANTLIEVESYDPNSETYEVVCQQYPGQGPLIVTPEELARTVSAVNIGKIMTDPKSVLHNQYSTDKVMNLLPPTFVEARIRRYHPESLKKQNKPTSTENSRKPASL